MDGWMYGSWSGYWRGNIGKGDEECLVQCDYHRILLD